MSERMKTNAAPLFALAEISVRIQQLNKALEEKFGLSLVQWSVLRHLIAAPAISAQDLAELIGIHPSSLTQTLKRLESKDFLCMEGHPRDQRRKMIFTTREGAAALRRLEREASPLLAEAEKHSSALREIQQGLEDVSRLMFDDPAARKNHLSSNVPTTRT